MSDRRSAWFKLPASMRVQCVDDFDSFKNLKNGELYDVTHLTSDGFFTVVDNEGRVLPGWSMKRFIQWCVENNVAVAK